MRTYEKIFPNPLLAIAFKEGVNFVGDPDMKARSPEKVNDGSGNYKVVVEDDNDYDEDEEETTTSVQAPKPTLEEFREATRKNMKPVNAKREGGTTIIPTIAEPSSTPKPGKGRVIIPVDDDDDELTTIKGCGTCLNCKLDEECVYVLEAACEVMDGRER